MGLSLLQRNHEFIRFSLQPANSLKSKMRRNSAKWRIFAVTRNQLFREITEKAVFLCRKRPFFLMKKQSVYPQNEKAQKKNCFPTEKLLKNAAFRGIRKSRFFSGCREKPQNCPFSRNARLQPSAKSCKNARFIRTQTQLRFLTRSARNKDNFAFLLHNLV